MNNTTTKKIGLLFVIFIFFSLLLWNCLGDDKDDGNGNPTICNDECSPSGNKECSGNSYRTCGSYDSDSCLEWSSLTACGSNETCSNGNCSSNNTSQTLTLTVDAHQNLLNVDATGPAKISLDSSKSYTISASGSVSLGGYGVTCSDVFYWCWMGTGSGNANDSYGELSNGQSKTITNCSTLYGFFIDSGTPGSNDNSGSMTISITAN